MRTKLLQTFALGIGFAIAACSSSSSDDSAGTGATGAGGHASAGTGNTSTAGYPGTGGSVGAGGTTSTATGGTTGIAGTSFGTAGSLGTTGGTVGAGGGLGSAGTGTGGTGFPPGGSGGTAGAGDSGGHGGNGFGGAGGAVHMGGAGGSTGTAGAGGSGGGTMVTCNGPALTGGTQHCSSNGSGTANSFTWTIWSSGSGGCMTTYNTGAAFKATWNNSGDFLAREGFQWDETKTYDQLGTISADYSYTKSGSGGGYSYIGIYGWSNNPLVEYYIVDDWFGNGPPTGGGTKKGTFTVDGAEYDVYEHTQNNQPSIHGNATFPQFFSVRKTARQCGHISISEHFKEWASLGLNLGKMYEAKLLVEVGGGQGSIDYSVGNMTAK